MTSPLQTTQFFGGEASFYNDATSTSMRFRRGLGSNTEINRDPSSAGNRKKHTLAFWVKRCKPSDGSQVILGAFASSYSDFFYFRSDDRLEYSVGNAYSVATDMVFRDVSAWYHIVAHFDVANSTTTSRLRFWVNGVGTATIKTSELLISLAALKFPFLTAEWTSSSKLGSIICIFPSLTVLTIS